MQNIVSPNRVDKLFDTNYNEEVLSYSYSRNGCGKNNTHDRSSSMTKSGITINSIFDGHGQLGYICADYLNNHLPDILMTKITPIIKSGMIENQIISTLQQVITKTFQDFNMNIRDKSIPGGSTATVVIITKKFGMVCFIGDSPFFIKTQSGKILAQTTTNHSYNNESERRRVELAGGAFMSTSSGYDCIGVWDGPLNQGVLPSRAFGHFLLSGVVSSIIPDPEFITFEIPDGEIVMSFLFTDFVTEEIGSQMDQYGYSCYVIRNQRNFVEDICPMFLNLYPNDISNFLRLFSVGLPLKGGLERWRTSKTICPPNFNAL